MHDAEIYTYTMPDGIREAFFFVSADLSAHKKVYLMLILFLG